MSAKDDAGGWAEILKGKYKPFDVEKSIYIQSQRLANSPLMFAQYIIDGLRPGDVPENFMKLYREAVYGTNPKVKSRIISRIYNIGRIVRDAPEVKEIDMLHAPDYGKLNLSSLKKKLKQRKSKDSQIENSMFIAAQTKAKKSKSTDAEVDMQKSITEEPTDEPQASTSSNHPYEMFIENDSDDESSGKQPSGPTPTEQGQAFGGHAKDERSKPKVDPTPKEKIPLKKGEIILSDAESDENNVIPSSQTNNDATNDKIKCYGKKKLTKRKKINKFDEVKTADNVEKQGANDSKQSSGKDEENMEDVFKSFNEEGIKKKKAKVDTAELKRDLKKMSKLATSLLIDQKALAMAQSVENGYDLDKYRQKVVQAMSDVDSDNESNN